MRVYRSHVIDDGWSENQVRDALRNSSEYRQAEHDDLRQGAGDRPPGVPERAAARTDSGARDYVTKVMNDKWTQQDVERELRKSPEYRQPIRTVFGLRSSVYGLRSIGFFADRRLQTVDRRGPRASIHLQSLLSCHERTARPLPPNSPAHLRGSVMSAVSPLVSADS